MMKSSTMDRPSHAGLRHLALNVRDVAAMQRFYVDLLGFAVEWETDADNLHLSSGIDNLEPHSATRLGGAGHAQWRPLRPAGRAGGDAAVLDHLGLLVRWPDEVAEWAAFLEAKGVTLDA